MSRDRLAALWKRLYQQSDDVAIHRVEQQIQAIEADLLAENARLRATLVAIGDADGSRESMSPRYAVMDCPGWNDQGGTDALGQRRCTCGWPWVSHRAYGRPHPPEPPPDYDIDDPAWLARWNDDES